MSKSALLVIDLQNKYLPTGKLLDHRLRSLFATVPVCAPISSIYLMSKPTCIFNISRYSIYPTTNFERRI